MVENETSNGFTWLDDVNQRFPLHLNTGEGVHAAGAPLSQYGSHDGTPAPSPSDGGNDGGGHPDDGGGGEAGHSGDGGGPSNPSAPGGGGASPAQKGTVPLPEKLQWVNNPQELSAVLAKFMAKNPMHPGNASPETQKIFGGMKPPATNYGPPTGANKEAMEYWYSYFGFPKQYAHNKVSAESKDNAKEWVNKTQAAGLGQVRPGAARQVGFDFGDLKGQNLQGEKEIEVYKAAMQDPNLASLLTAMVSRYNFNRANGDPIKAEAIYFSGEGNVNRALKHHGTLPGPEYIQKMFPNQWPTKP